MNALSTLTAKIDQTDSGVEWLGDIPSHWKLKKLKFVVEIVKRIAGKLGYDVLSITQKGIKLKDVESGEGQLSMDYSKYQLLFKGEFAMNHMDLLTGYVDISNLDGVVSPDYRVFKNRSSEVLDEYLLLIFQMGYAQRIFYRYGQGVSFMGRWRFPADNFKNFNIPIPPLNEQEKIVQFLSEKSALLDEAILIKNSQITLLQERKVSIIQNAVTKGINKNVSMKESGINWLGKIPEHWGAERSQWLFSQRREKATKTDEQLTASQKYGMISQKEYMEIEGRRVTQVVFNSEILKHVEANDFVISMRSFQGGIEYCPLSGCVSSAYVPLIPDRHVYPPYFKYLFKCRRYIEALQSTSNLVRDGQALRYENFRMVDLPVVPIAEQQQISEFLDQQVENISNSIDVLSEQILRLKEYKTSLIYNAVTGKIDIS